MQGKLNGVMPATTPSGWRSVQLSIPLDTWSVKSPLSSCGIPQANSAISMPRVTSPCASLSTLPCSLVMSAASASRRSVSSATKRASTRARRTGGVFAQAGSADCALATAAATSAGSAQATCRATAPLAGSNTSSAGPAPLTARPPIQCGTVAAPAGAGGGLSPRAGRLDTTMLRRS